MNHSPFWPLVWKEYRVGRAFWLAMAIMGLVAQGGVAWLAHQSADRNWWLYGIALMISAGFAVGIGGTLFAVEHEERTIALLRRLPVRTRQLGAAKMLAALAGLIALVAVLWLAASAMAGWQSLPAPRGGQLWRLWGLACLEGLAWGVLCSLIIRSPLQATVVAALAVALIDSCAVMLVENHDFSAAPSVFLRTTLLVLVLWADGVLLPCWFAGHLPRWQRVWQRVRSVEPAWRRPVTHLAWQTFRDGRASFLLLILAGPAAFVLFEMSFRLFRDANRLSGTDLFSIVMPLALAAIDGALVFRADQLHGPRFLAGQGVSPGAVWFSRQLVWGFWLWALTAIIVFLFVAQFSMLLFEWVNGQSRAGLLDHLTFRYRSDTFSPLPLRQVLLPAYAAWQMLLPVYAAGQLASLLVRRGLLAVTLGLVLGALASFWVWSMQVIGASWWWSVLPLPIGFFLATWLRLPAWLVERPGLRAWLAPGAAALLPVVGLLIAVPAYRVLQIPVMNPEFVWPDRSPAAIADAHGTLALYTKAWDIYLANRGEATERPADHADSSTGSPADDGWRKQVAALAIEASRRDSSLLALPVLERRAAAPRIQDLANFLVRFAKQEQKTGKLDMALDAYLATFAVEAQLHECCGSCLPNYQQTFHRLQVWAAAPGQTAERIRTAIKRLNECHAEFPTPDAWLLPAYEESVLTIDDLAAAGAAEIVPAKELELADWITSRIPSERARARRMLDGLAEFQITPARNEFAFLTGRIPMGQISQQTNSDLQSRQSSVDFETIFRNFPTTPLVEHSALLPMPLARNIWREETSYRATVIILALNAWRIEHGQLPDRLDELVGAELDALPLDPPFARPFLYYPRGMPARQAASTSAPSEPGAGDLPTRASDKHSTDLLPLVTDEPFLWSVLSPKSPRLLTLGPSKSAVDRSGFPYELVERGEVEPYPEPYLLSAGTVYPIPSVEEAQP